MLGRFENYVTKNNALRAYNAAVAMLVLVNYYNTPNASTSEFFFDIGVHLLQAAISSDSNPQIKAFSIAVNSARIFTIFANTATGTSTIPLAANIVDVLNHGVNLAATAS